nr:gliding motility-associated C-terminal domain-containing protein [Allomuricauda sp.]
MNLLRANLKRSLFISVLCFVFCGYFGFSQNCTVSAGSAQTICENLGTYNLAGSTTGSVLTGPTWSQIGGPVITIDDTTDLTTEISGFIGGNTYTFRLSAICTDTTPVFDDVVITVEPTVTANAGSDQTLNQLTSVFLNATAPASGVGTWTQLSGPNLISFANDNDPATEVTGAMPGTYFFQWTVDNGTCPAVSDVVAIAFSGVDLELDISASSLTPDIGDVVTFTVNLSNLGDVGATGVSVTNLVPLGYGSISAITNGGSFASGTRTITWTGLNVPLGTNTVTLTFNATVLTPTGTAGEFTHIAEVTGIDQFDSDSLPNNDDGDQSEDDEDAITVSPQQADLSLVKVVVGNDLTPNVGEEISFEITVTNSGPDDATNVQVVDQLLSGFNFVRYTATSGVYNETTGIWQVGTILNGASERLVINVLVNASGLYSNTSQVIASDAFDIDSTPANGVSSEDDQGNVVLTPVSIVDLSLTKDVNNPNPNVNTNVVFTLTVTNDGPSDATNVLITDQLPSGFAYDSDDGAGAYINTSGIWTVGNLANGASATLNITATVNTTGVFTNVAEITAQDQTDSDSTPNNGILAEDDQDDALVNPVQIVDISVTKTADDLTPNVGDPIVFTVSVTNDGPSDATNVVVTDVLASGYAFVSSTPSTGLYDALSGSWTVGNLANGVTETLSITANVLTTGDYTNTAELTDVNETDIDSQPANNDGTEDDQQTINPVPVLVSDLVLRKSVDDLSPFVGEEVIFNVSISNDGPSDVTGVEVLDLLPSGYTYVSNSRTAGVYDPVSGIWELNGTIPNGTTETLNITALVNPAGDYFNVAEVFASDNLDPNSTPNNNVLAENDQDIAGTTPLPSADVSLQKTVDNEFPDVLDNVTFTLTVTNDGPSDATGVVVSDPLPSGYTYISDDSAGSYSVATGEWNIGTMIGGSTSVLNITVQANPTGDYSNVAEVISAIQPDPDSTPGNNILSEDDQDEQSTSPRILTDVSITKTVDNLNPPVGDQITFTITANNASPNDATNLVIEDVIASGYTFVSAVPSSGTYDSVTGAWALASLGNGSTETLQITVTVLQNGIYANTAELIAMDTFDPDSTPNNNLISEDDQDSVVPIPNGLADLSLTKTVDNPTPNVGDVIEFTLNLTNNGASDATGVVVSDLLPEGFAYQSGVATAGIYQPSTGLWSINGSIPDGTTETLIVLVTVNPPTGNTDEYLNVAEITSSDFADPDSNPNTSLDQDDLNDGLPDDDEATVQVTPQTVDISLSKVVDNPEPTIGDEVVFTITIINQGSSIATNVGIEEVLPLGYRLITSQVDIGVYDESSGFWEMDQLMPSETAILTLTVEVLDEDAYLNIASLSFVDQFDIDETNNTADAFVEPSCLTVYNEFSPNGDGVNETFTIDCISRYPNNVLSVYNRWGTIVFEQRSYNNDWDGTSNGRAVVQKGQQLPVGTYYYVLDLGDGSSPRTDWLYINR